jgi:hypothetical protein
MFWFNVAFAIVDFSGVQFRAMINMKQILHHLGLWLRNMHPIAARTSPRTLKVLTWFSI